MVKNSLKTLEQVEAFVTAAIVVNKFDHGALPHEEEKGFHFVIEKRVNGFMVKFAWVHTVDWRKDDSQITTREIMLYHNANLLDFFADLNTHINEFRDSGPLEEIH